MRSRFGMDIRGLLDAAFEDRYFDTGSCLGRYAHINTPQTSIKAHISSEIHLLKQVKLGLCTFSDI